MTKDVVPRIIRPEPTLYGMAKTLDVVGWCYDHGVRPLFMSVSGSHMWGLNRPDSDLDVRGIYIAPTEQVLSLRPRRDTIEGLGQLGGDVDFQMYELGKALHMLLQHNGNIVEMLLAPTCFYRDGTDWQGIARRFLTKRLLHYYRGYYTSQRKRAMANRGGKAVVYTAREAMAGIWLMRTGTILYDFRALLDAFERECFAVPVTRQYLERATWREPMTAGAIWDFEREWGRLEEALVNEAERSSLPDDHDGFEELNALLLEMRSKEWGKSQEQR